MIGIGSASPPVEIAAAGCELRVVKCQWGEPCDDEAAKPVTLAGLSNVVLRVELCHAHAEAVAWAKIINGVVGTMLSEYRQSRQPRHRRRNAAKQR